MWITKGKHMQPHKRYLYKDFVKKPGRIYIKFPSRNAVEIIIAILIGMLAGLYLLTGILK